MYGVVLLDESFGEGLTEIIVAVTSRQYTIKLKAGQSLSLPLATNRRSEYPIFKHAKFSSCERKPKDDPDHSALACGPYLTYNKEKVSWEVDGSLTASDSRSWMKYESTLTLKSLDLKKQPARLMQMFDLFLILEIEQPVQS